MFSQPKCNWKDIVADVCIKSIGHNVNPIPHHSIEGIGDPYSLGMLGKYYVCVFLYALIMMLSISFIVRNSF